MIRFIWCGLQMPSQAKSCYIDATLISLTLHEPPRAYARSTMLNERFTMLADALARPATREFLAALHALTCLGLFKALWLWF